MFKPLQRHLRLVQLSVNISAVAETIFQLTTIGNYLNELNEHAPQTGPGRFPWDLLAIQSTVVFLDAGHGGNPISDHARLGVPREKKGAPEESFPTQDGQACPQPLRACLKGRKWRPHRRWPARRARGLPSTIRPRSPPLTPPYRPHGPPPPEHARPPPSSPSSGKCEHPRLQPCAPLPPCGSAQGNLLRTTSGRPPASTSATRSKGHGREEPRRGRVTQEKPRARALRRGKRSAPVLLSGCVPVCFPSPGWRKATGRAKERRFRRQRFARYCWATK